jgi:SAM-dependent methyltransferase
MFLSRFFRQITPRFVGKNIDISLFPCLTRTFVYYIFSTKVVAISSHAAPGTAEIVLDVCASFVGDSTCSLSLANLGAGSTNQYYELLGYNVVGFDSYVLSGGNLSVDLNCPDPIAGSHTFDVCVAQELIEHLENPWTLFRHVKHILKPNGYFLLTTPNIAQLKSRLKFLLSGSFCWFGPDHLEYHINPLSSWEIFHIAKTLGFSLVEVKGSSEAYVSSSNPFHISSLASECIVYVFRGPSC